jgi:hypothetical protein
VKNVAVFGLHAIFYIPVRMRDIIESMTKDGIEEIVLPNVSPLP